MTRRYAGPADGGHSRGDPRDRVDELLAGLEDRLRAVATRTTGRTGRCAPTATCASETVVVIEPD